MTQPQPFHVYPQLPENAPPTFGVAGRVYLEHLALQVEAEQLSRAAFFNIRRNVSRFLQAWSVIASDGRHWLVPMAEPDVASSGGRRQKRRVPLKYSAATADEAIVQAEKIAAGTKVGSLVGGMTLGEPRVRRNADRAIGEGHQDDLTRWLTVNPQWKSGCSKDDALKQIVGCLTWFADEYNVPSPYRWKRLPKFVKKARREARTDEYVALMRRGCRELRRALWCLYNLGVRPCEMREMLWTDFNWEGGFVLTYTHKTARKEGKPRLITLNRRQLRFFRNVHRQRPPWPENVFLNTDGKTWTKDTFCRHLRRLAKRIGLDDGVAERVSAYCIRHTVATEADEGGALNKHIGLVLGHKGGRMVRTVYSKASKKVRHHRKVAKRIEQLRRKARRQGSEDQKELF